MRLLRPFAVAVTIIASTSVLVMTPAAAQQALPAPAIRQSAGSTLDEQLLDMAKRDPGFGGMFIDSDGRLTMYVMPKALEAQDGHSRLAAMSVDAITTFRENDQVTDAAATRRINVIPAQYSFISLYDWHQRLASHVLSGPRVVLTDISESSNRLRVGVEGPDGAQYVRERMAALGIPQDAVVIELTKPFRPLATLRNKFRPLVGGLQINFDFYVCTLGFMAVREGVSGMVTNSHCTRTQGRNNNTIFHQPTASGTANRIGAEVFDPPFFTGSPCPARRKCRYSDTAFARIPHPSGPPVTSARGMIARPPEVNSLTLTTGRFRITSENSFPVLNETLNKVGRTTGWSRGKVVATCLNVNVSGTDITLLCQDIVKARVAAGDSGSPVFRVLHNPARNDVRLYGVLWGGGTLPGYGTVFAFSAFGARNIQRASELGRLTTCAPGFRC